MVSNFDIKVWNCADDAVADVSYCFNRPTAYSPVPNCRGGGLLRRGVGKMGKNFGKF